MTLACTVIYNTCRIKRVNTCAFVDLWEERDVYTNPWFQDTHTPAEGRGVRVKLLTQPNADN